MYLKSLSNFLRSRESLWSHVILLTSSFATGLGVYGLHRYQTLTIGDLFRPELIWAGYWLPVAVLWYASWIIWSMIQSRWQKSNMVTTLQEDAISYIPMLLLIGVWVKHIEMPAVLAVIPAIAGFTAFKLRPFLHLIRQIRLSYRFCLALVAGGMVAYTVIFSIMGGLRFLAFRSFSDFAIFVQQVWNFSNFDYYFLLSIGYLPFGNHFSPILFLIAPFYWIWEDPIMIIIVQNAVISLGALPLYWMACERLGSPVAGLVAAGAYLLYPGIQFLSLGDFHESLLAGTPILFGFHYLFKKSYLKAWIFMLLVMMCKEDTPLIIFMFGVYAFFIQHQRRQGLSILIVATVWFVASVGIIIPSSQQDGFNWLHQFLPGAGSSEVVTSSLTERLGDVAVHFLSIVHLKFMLQLLVPVGILALLSPPEFLIGVPGLLELMLYMGPPYGMVGTTFTWHMMVVVPAFFISAIFGIERLVNAHWFQSIPGNRFPRSLCIIYLGLSSIFSSIAYGAYPYSVTFRTDDFQITAHDRIGHEILKVFPQGASVSTTSQMSPFLGHRKELYLLPIPFKSGNWLGNKAARPKVVDYVVVDTSRAVLDEMTTGQDVGFLDAVRAIGQHPDYETVIARDGYVVFKHKSVPAPSGIK